MFNVGRVCLKVAGREAGKYCVIVKKMDDNFVMITGPKELTSVKRRRCNIDHLEPLMETLDIKADASDSDVIKAYEKANLIKKLGIEPSEKKERSKPTKPKKDSSTNKPKKSRERKTTKAAPKKKK